MFSTFSGVSAERALVEDVFLDISADYTYRDELQTLYDRGMILPSEDQLFHPQELLNRDEFVGISMEVVCERCIWPHTELQFLQNYTTKDVYFDVQRENPYFYCIAEADANNYVRWYDIGESCQNGEWNPLERPFCPENRINLEEAVAVLLRNSGIFTINDNAGVIASIYAGNTTATLWNDVKPKDSEGKPYTFYGYLQKALDYEIYDYDAQGNQKKLTLLELDNDGNINPQSFISKEEFLRMSYIALKSNNCREVSDDGLALQIRVQDKVCKPSDDINCSLSDLNDPENTYDFVPEVETSCELWVDEATWYIWRFHNENSGQQIFRYTKYIDDFRFPSEGIWRIYSRVIDRCWNSSEVFSTIEIWVWLSVSFDADPIAGYEALDVNFIARVNGGVGPFEYLWDFGDGSSSVGLELWHLFERQWIYTVKLTVIDSQWNRASATGIIEVYDDNSCQQDTDGDGINDCEDSCPRLAWDISNSGCPIYELWCGDDCSCPEGYTCSSNDPNVCSNGAICVPITPKIQSCLYRHDRPSIFGGAVCNSCPCDQGLDFFADMRACDIIFPAITSPDGSSVYSRGNLWQIQ